MVIHQPPVSHREYSRYTIITLKSQNDNRCLVAGTDVELTLKIAAQKQSTRHDVTALWPTWPVETD